ncbi:hypothetical protein JCGZ_02874 [Jatropha curcas]|uniref:Uncharacterized protein n=1 Tax=Jatropha curcas TaxID=180498 RepID=A0A067LE47_JATCU|nr:hypothetical protein JCGZ_02874 [Jatropha curcas]
MKILLGAICTKAKRPSLTHKFFATIDPSRETASRVWHRHPGQRLLIISPIPEFVPVSSVSYSSSSDSEPDSDSVEMADDIGGESSAGLNIEELYKEEKKKNRGFGNYRTSYGDRSAGGNNQNQSGNSNAVVGAVNERARREFTDLGRPLSTVLRSCIKNGVLSKLPVDPTKPMQGSLPFKRA